MTTEQVPNTNLQAYGDFSHDDADAAEQDISSKAKFYKLKEGSTLARILPPRVGEKALVTTHQHFVKVAREGKTFTICIPCARLIANKPCIVCKKLGEMERLNNPADRKMIDDMSPRSAAYLNMVVRGFRPAAVRDPIMVPIEKQGIVTFSPSPTVVQQLTEMRRDAGDFTNPVAGFDVVFNRKGTGANDTKYKVSPAKTPAPLLHPDPVVANEWIQGQPDLRDKRRALTELEQREVLQGKKRDDERTAFPGDDVIDAEFTAIGDAATGAGGDRPRTAQDDMGGGWE